MLWVLFSRVLTSVQEALGSIPALCVVIEGSEIQSQPDIHETASEKEKKPSLEL